MHKHIEKKCVSLVINKNRTESHGQQYIHFLCSNLNCHWRRDGNP